MGDYRDILLVFRPVVKNWWVLVIFTCLGLAYGWDKFEHTKPSYEARSAILIRDKSDPLKEWLEEFEPFSLVGEYLQELAKMRSVYMIEKAMNKLDLRVSHFQVDGKKRKRLYPWYPFRLTYHLRDSTALDQEYFVRVEHKNYYSISRLPEDTKPLVGKFGEKVLIDEMELTLWPDSSLNRTSLDSMRALNYSFIIHSHEEMISFYSDPENTFVRLQNEKVSIINVYFWHEVPELAADFVNAMTEAYMEDFVAEKQRSADSALHNIDRQMAEVEQMLIEAEINLAEYQAGMGKWDISSSTSFRMELLEDVQTRHLNLELKKTDLEQLADELQKLDPLGEFSISYGSVRDQVYGEVLTGLDKMMQKRKSLAGILSNEHPGMQKLTSAIIETRNALISSVNHTIEKNRSKIYHTESSISDLHQEITALSGIEMELLDRQRKIKAYETAYLKLLEKRTEAVIAAASDLSYHKILEVEIPPAKPIGPFRNIMVGTRGLFGFLWGIVAIFTFRAVRSVVTHRMEIQERVPLPSWEVIHRKKSMADGMTVGAMNLALGIAIKNENQIIAVSAAREKHGKSEMVSQLGKASGAIGSRTLMIDADLTHRRLHRIEGIENESGLGEWIHTRADWKTCITKIKDGLFLMPVGNQPGLLDVGILQRMMEDSAWPEIRRMFDKIIINCPTTQSEGEAALIMQAADKNFFVVRDRKTRWGMLKRLEKMNGEQKFQDMELIYVESELGSKKQWKLFGGQRYEMA